MEALELLQEAKKLFVERRHGVYVALWDLSPLDDGPTEHKAMEYLVIAQGRRVLDTYRKRVNVFDRAIALAVKDAYELQKLRVAA